MDHRLSFPIRADKSFGQHFLHERGVIAKIIAFAGNLKDVQVIEIGPGPGTLTEALLATDAAQITAVEIDPRMLPHLEERAASSGGRLRVLHADALKLEIADLCPAPRAIIANLPYNVATPLLVGWLHAVHADARCLARMTLMFQKEVAERIAAAPNTKDYGRLAVLAQWLCRVEYGFDIAPGCFTPPPKVISAVIRLTPREHPWYPADKEALERLLAAGFGQRRKMLRSALKSLLGGEAEAILAQAGIDATRRAETLSVEEWCALAREYAKTH